MQLIKDWKYGYINVRRFYHITFVIIVLLTTIIFRTHITYWLQENIFHQIQYIEKCFDDLNSISPYIIPQGQSVLSYDPTVIINKNQSYSNCKWVPEGYTSDPKRDCPLDSQYVLTPMIPMSNSLDLKRSIKQIQEFIIKSSFNKSIIYFQSLSTTHCSIQYFSCYNYFQYKKIQEVFGNFYWNSFIITFNKISCDVTTVGSYLLIEADLLSQKKLFKFVRKLEKQINKQNIKINIPRIENFHLTLIGVNYNYPSNCIINKINKQFIPNLKNQLFGSVRICCFITKIGLNITYYYAQDCNQNDHCVSDVK